MGLGEVCSVPGTQGLYSHSGRVVQGDRAGDRSRGLLLGWGVGEIHLELSAVSYMALWKSLPPFRYIPYSRWQGTVVMAVKRVSVPS